MKIHRRPLLVFVPLLLAVWCSLATAGSPGRIGLHVTTQELEIWRQRAQHGPYRSPSDVSTNSPGDWQRITSQANEFLANPRAEIWSGQTSGCWAPSGPPATPSRMLGARMRDAAFVSLVMDDARYREAVVEVLLAQAAQPGTDFSGPRWCNTAIGDGYSHEIVSWLMKILFAYDYIRPAISSAQRAVLDRWFDNAALFWSEVVDKTVERAFPYRERGDYETTPHGRTCVYGACTTHYAGWTFYDIHEHWNNRNSIQIAFAGSAALVTNNTLVQQRAKRYFKEWLRFAVFPDGTDSDFRRWTSSIPSLGWQYAGLMISTMGILADHFARAGDFELYEYSTSEGFRDLTPAGGPKSLQRVILLHFQLTNGDILRYGTASASNVGNPNYAINALDPLSGHYWVHDSYMVQPNIYFRDDFIRSVYLHDSSGTIPYPANPSTGGWGAWNGAWGAFPGVMLMFAMQENRVWPYAPTQTSLPKPPLLTAIE